MKLSHEYVSEAEAEGRERELTVMGYLAWRTRKADGRWQVFWWVGTDASTFGASKAAA